MAHERPIIYLWLFSQVYYITISNELRSLAIKWKGKYCILIFRPVAMLIFVHCTEIFPARKEHYKDVSNRNGSDLYSEETQFKWRLGHRTSRLLCLVVLLHSSLHMSCTTFNYIKIATSQAVPNSRFTTIEPYAI